MGHPSALPTIRQLHVFEREILSEAGQGASRPSRHVVAAAVFKNPYAGRGAASKEDLDHLVDISTEIGALLTERVLARFAGQERPRAYGKAIIVGMSGESEHGAAMIHPRLGLSMRKGLGAGPALIPGNAKVASAGASIDVVFGGAEDAWDYYAMDGIVVRPCSTNWCFSSASERSGSMPGSGGPAPNRSPGSSPTSGSKGAYSTGAARADGPGTEPPKETT